MGELEARILAAHGYKVSLDEPWQHYHFAGRADVIGWDDSRRAMLHVENKSQLPDVQDGLGRFHGTQRYLSTALGARLVPGGRPASETHVLAVLWSSEVLRVIRRQPATFRATFPDPIEAFRRWCEGDPPGTGFHSTIVLIDPFATDRQRLMVGLDEALDGVRPRVAGYAEAAARLRRGLRG